MTTIGIIGYGFVGKAVAQLRAGFEVAAYDPFVEEVKTEEHKHKAYKSDIVFVCVPTPPLEDGHLDVSIVEEVAEIWTQLRTPSSILVIKSTVPIGTTDSLCARFGTNRILHNPEFLTEKTAVDDFCNAREIIIGGNKEVAQIVIDMYRTYYSLPDRGEATCWLLTYQYHDLVTAKTAEMIKLVRNAFYATKISFMNEVYDLCEATDTSYDQFREVFARSHEQAWVNPMHTFVPGPRGKEFDKDGACLNANNRFFAGHCLPKDSLGLVENAHQFGVDLKVLEQAVKSNEEHKTHYS